MKISFVLGKRDALDQQTAQVCAATNLGMPGFGSIMAGRVIGYAQATFTIAGFALTLIGGVRSLIWFVSNWSKLYDPMADGLENLRAMWLSIRWPLLGMLLFGVAWIWAALTSWQILHSVSSGGKAEKPPPLG